MLGTLPWVLESEVAGLAADIRKSGIVNIKSRDMPWVNDMSPVLSRVGLDRKSN